MKELGKTAQAADRSKRKTWTAVDSLDIMDKFYEKKYQDMETRLYRLYDEIEGVENNIEEVKNRLLNISNRKYQRKYQKKTSINFFYILINYMISSPTWRRKNFLTAL